MRMQVLYTPSSQPEPDATGLSQIGKVDGKWALRAAAHKARQHRCPQQPYRPREQHSRDGQQQGWGTFTQDEPGAVSLNLVLRVCEILIPTAQRYSRDFETSAFERANFTADKGMAYLWIFVDQIGDTHADFTYTRLDATGGRANGRA